MAPADHQKISTVTDANMFLVFDFLVHLVADHAIDKMSAIGVHDVIKMRNVIESAFKRPILHCNCVASRT